MPADAAVRPARLPPRPAITAIVALHAEEAAHLWHVRTRLVDAPDIGIAELARHDERIAAHLDGLVVAGDDGARIARDSLPPGPAPLALALLRRDEEEFMRLVDAARADVSLAPGLEAALAWIPKPMLHGFVARLLASEHASDRVLGLAACASHDVEAGPALNRALDDADPRLRMVALRTLARRGLIDHRDRCVSMALDADPACGSEAATTAVLLGDRGAALDRLESQAITGDLRAAALLFKAVASARVRPILSTWFRAAMPERMLIRGVGIAGDVSHVDWLIERLAVPATARVAAEAFVSLTGVDLVRERMSVPQPADAIVGPDDDPAHEDVGLDEDDGLPWPDPPAIAAWWRRHGARFAPSRRWLLGGEPTRGHLLAVLANGKQRQRRDAADHLCLTEPGTPLFDVAAPVARQRAMLARLG